MRNYEIAVVLHPDLEIDIENVSKKIEKIIEDLGGKITKKDNWGKKKLAYTINKQDFGIYTFYTVETEPKNVRPINDRLRITEEVMRYLIVSLENVRYLKKPNQKPAAKNEASDTKTIEEKV